MTRESHSVTLSRTRHAGHAPAQPSSHARGHARHANEKVTHPLSEWGARDQAVFYFGISTDCAKNLSLPDGRIW